MTKITMDVSEEGHLNVCGRHDFKISQGGTL